MMVDTDIKVVSLQDGFSGGAGARFSIKRAYAYTFTSTFVVRLVGVLSGLLVARLLGPSGRGELAIIISLALLITTVGEFEIPRSLAFQYSKDQGQESGEMVASGFWLALLLGLLQMCFGLLILRRFLPADKLYLIRPAAWFLLYIPLFYVMTFLSGADQGRGYFGRFSIIQALPGFGYLAGVLALWALKCISPTQFAFAVLGGMFVAAAARLLVERKAILRYLPTWHTARKLLKCGAIFYAPAVTWLALSRADMLLLVRIISTSSIGIYVVAQAIAYGQNGMMGPFIAVGFTAVASEVESDTALNVMARHFRVAAIISIVVALVSIAATPWIIRFAFGPQYLGATGVACFLILATSVSSLSLLLDQGLRAAGYTTIGVLSNVSGLFLLFTVGTVSAIRFGIIGLSCSVLAAQLISLAILIVFCVFRLKLRLKQFVGFWSTCRYIFASSRESFRSIRSASARLSTG